MNAVAVCLAAHGRCRLEIRSWIMGKLVEEAVYLIGQARALSSRLPDATVTSPNLFAAGRNAWKQSGRGRFAWSRLRTNASRGTTLLLTDRLSMCWCEVSAPADLVRAQYRREGTVIKSPGC